MPRKINAKDVTLDDLKKQFGLHMTETVEFFDEWQSNLPEISDEDKRILDKTRAGYLNLVEHPPIIEDTIKLAILSPLLLLANFYLQPFRMQSEKPIQLSTTDDDADKNEDELLIEGKIDVLILREHLWVMVIESKRPAYSLESGFAQMLSYMLASPNLEKGEPNYGMITNGGSFIFVKVAHNTEGLRYATSRPFALRTPGNELYVVLQILKRLSEILFTPE
ncbi:MAG: restriction endonuclease subunit R [Chloroflexota bacterium]